MNTIFSNNLKRFRQNKNYTQEQVADILGVSSHSVSRWECGTTLPDVLMLPEIAKLYEITTDDLYKKNSVAYDNYAQRLSSVYENSHDPEDFFRCRNEYLKLIKQGELSTQDKWLYGWIHMCMMNYCRDTAIEWYDKAISDNPNIDPQNYRIACMQRIWMYFLLNKGDEIIAELTEKVKENPDNVRETDNLITALSFAKKYEEAFAVFKEAIKRFPDDWNMYIHGGDLCKWLKKYDEALTYYDKAGEIGTYFCDELYSKANLYEDLEDYKKAHDEYMNIAEILHKRGFDVEADRAKEYAKENLEKLNK